MISKRCLCLMIICLSLAAPMNICAQTGQSEYIIKKGDTLWDIAGRERRNNSKWREIWDSNRYIENPNRIYPGDKLHLGPVDMSVPSASSIQPADSKSIAPAPSAQTQPVTLSPMPESASGQPEFHPGTTAVPDQQNLQTPQRYFGQLTRQQAMTSYYFSRIDQIGFIRTVSDKPIGYIFKAKGDMEMIGTGHTVYIKETEHPGQGFVLGKQYMTYTTKLIKNKKTGEVIGNQYIMTGIVEITYRDDQVTVAKVIKAYDSIHKGHFLMPYNAQSPVISYTESPKGMKGKIVMAEGDNSLIGQDIVAFIDKGKQDGISVGQRFLVYDQEVATPDPKTGEKITLPPVDFATLLVLHVEDNFSTIIVTYSAKHIEPGNTFRSMTQ